MSEKLSERDVCSKYITPALQKAGWDLDTQIREEVSFTKGRINVHGRLISRGEKKRADYILYYKNNLPLALIEAKDKTHSVGSGMQQALDYAEVLDVPFVYSSNGDGFLEHDRLSVAGEVEREFKQDEFPGPEELYKRFREQKGLTSELEEAVLQDYYQGQTASTPRYYQRVAINRAVEAVARGQNRILLVMATGTGKTYTAFQIIWRLWKARKKKRILFLVDRTSLASQTIRGDFRHFGDKLTRIKGRIADPAYEVYVALYQGIHSNEEERKLFKQFSPDFFDLIVVDECHRGSAKANSAWREILEYYSSATQIGLTATPKEDKDVSSSGYFGDPIYTYSLKQGIDDGFLAPYKVMRYILDKDIEWRPNEYVKDQHGNPIEDRVYGSADYDRNIIIKDRTELVAETITKFMKETDPMQKAIVFCVYIDHAERMRQALVNANPEASGKNHRYTVRITGDVADGRQELESFIDPESPYPVIVTTSKLLTTGVDAQTCKLIVLDSPINSMTEFKQIIGRGTRVKEEFGKFYFTIMDFRGTTRLFADPEFDGEPIKDSKERHIHETEDIESIAQEIDQETLSVEELKENDPAQEILLDPDKEAEKEKKTKPIIEGVDFNISTRMIQYIDPETGKLVAESLVDYSQKRIKEIFHSLDDFLQRWNESERKDAILKELEDKGIPLEELKKEIGVNFGEFDTILHVAFNRKPMTRSERAQKAREEGALEKYEGEAREILEALLEKYADQGILAVDDIGDLEVSPFTEFGTPIDIVNGIFGGRDQYMNALKDMQEKLFNISKE
ncbi:MAG: EcoAI/FtnUII family type I restriction enzme subunit R [Candidatus Paceibacterota bacterium]